MNTSILIPIHVCDDTITPLLDNAIQSIANQEKIDELPVVNLVYPPSIKECVVGFRDSQLRKHQDKITFNLIENDGDTDFQSQINCGVKNISDEYFSILEFDDEYNSTYFYNVSKHIKYFPDIEFFLTMIVEVNENNEGQKFTNEMVWAQQFVGENGEMGYLNINALRQNTDFKISGGVFKRDEFQNIGGLKKNIKLTFNYEFLLRALNNACSVFVIQKFGYKHTTMREGSLFKEYGDTMSMQERKFWFETANKESNFPTDRVIDMTQLHKIVVEEK